MQDFFSANGAEACKTAQRDRTGAERDMTESLKLLHTDWFDVYQLHGLVNMAELETVFAPGGAMELLRDMREKGIARKNRHHRAQ